MSVIVRIVATLVLCFCSGAAAHAVEHEGDFSSRIAAEWQQIEASARAENFPVTHEALQRLILLRDLSGFEALEDHSLALVSMAEESLAKSNRDGARFYLKNSRELSPRSLTVFLRGFSVAREVGEPVLSLSSQALWLFIQSPAAILSSFTALVYPLLWAGTIALYIGFVVFFVAHLRDILRSVALALPVHVRGFLSPLLTLALIVLPIGCGPGWCLVSWSVLVLFFAPRRRWLAFLTGAIFVLWGAAIPFRETIAYWMQDSRVAALIRVTSGTYRDGDQAALNTLARDRSEDGAVLFVLGVMQRRLGEFDDAERSFIVAEQILGPQPFTVAQRGLVSYLRGDLPKALEQMREAESLGLTSPEHLFNLSKVTFDLTDTSTSREYYQRAWQQDNKRVERLRAVEGQFGEQSKFAVAEIWLPFAVLFQAAAVPHPLATDEFERVSTSLVAGLVPSSVIGVGFLLIVSSLILGARRPRSIVCSYYSSYRAPRVLVGLFRIIPGAAWVVGGMPVRGVLCIAGAVLMSLPLIGWPTGCAEFFKVVPGAQQYYVACVSLLILIAVSCGLFIEEEESDALGNYKH